RELLKKVFSEDAFYHDPCHLAYGLAVSQEPRDILERCGIRVVNRTSGACCGFGGTYSIRFREESLRFAQARWRGIEASGAKAVFTACPGCMLQLQKGSHGVPVHHIIEAIEKALA
ncbi:MAG: heterodisulfide reductase-related iron-sulfur binding cluster, partial [bacterium]